MLNNFRFVSSLLPICCALMNVACNRPSDGSNVKQDGASEVSGDVTSAANESSKFEYTLFLICNGVQTVFRDTDGKPILSMSQFLSMTDEQSFNKIVKDSKLRDKKPVVGTSIPMCPGGAEARKIWNCRDGGVNGENIYLDTAFATSSLKNPVGSVDFRHGSKAPKCAGAAFNELLPQSTPKPIVRQ